MPKYIGVRKRGKNSYSYRIFDKGKEKEYSGYKTMAEAHRARKEHISELDKGKNLSKGEITFKKFIIRYLIDHVKIYNSSGTMQKTEGICRNHIVPKLGNKKLNAITTDDLFYFQKNLVRYKTPSIAYNTMQTIRQLFNKAVEWGYLPYTPLKGKLPPPPKTEYPTILLEKLFEVITGLEGHDKYIVAVLGFTGVRKSEVFGLMWSDIDFQSNTIAVKRQFVQRRIQKTKTDESKATIPMCSELALLLKEWKLQSGSFTWVFPGKNENPLAGEWWYRYRWQETKKIYNFPKGFRIHDFRHSFATSLLERDVRIENVQLLLRHKNLRTTAELYRHMIPSKLHGEVKVLDLKYRAKDRALDESNNKI